MALSDELAVVDKFVCTKGDVTRALGMAVETVLNNAMTNPSPAQRLKGQYATAAAAAAAGSRSGLSYSSFAYQNAQCKLVGFLICMNHFIMV